MTEFTTTWNPSQSDLAWTKKLLDNLAIMGVWGTTSGIYKKVAKDEICVIMMKMEIPSMYEDIARIKKCAEILGYKFTIGLK